MSKNKLALGRGLASLIPQLRVGSPPEPGQRVTDDGVTDQDDRPRSRSTRSSATPTSPVLISIRLRWTS